MDDVPLICSGAEPGPAKLLIWTSPIFPTGAFAFSHGLEWFAHRGLVRDEKSLQAWLTDLIEHGSLWNDLVLISLAWRAAMADDSAFLVSISELSSALHPSAERHLEAVTQGNAFRAAMTTAWATERWTALSSALPEDATIPVVFGTACAAHMLPLPASLTAYAVGFLSNLTSVAIRLGIVGQNGAQRILASLLAHVAFKAEQAADANEDDLGSAAFALDLASMQHETQDIRLFRS